MTEMHRRIHTWDPKCPRCGQENEYLTHALFFCTVPRATWAISDLPVRVDNLPLNFTDTFLYLTNELEENQITILCNMLWVIWKAKNMETFTNKRMHPVGILAQARMLNMEENIIEQARVQQHRDQAWVPGQVLVPNQHSVPGTEMIAGLEYDPHQERRPGQVRIPIKRWVVLVDASWEQSKKSGWGAVYYTEEGALSDIRCEQGMAEDPLHAEAIALLCTLQNIERRLNIDETQRYTILSDCKVLVEAVNRHNEEAIPSWRATETIVKCARLAQQLGDTIIIKQIPRTALSEPHVLANHARRTGMVLLNIPHERIRNRLGIQDRLDFAIFCFEQQQETVPSNIGTG